MIGSCPAWDCSFAGEKLKEWEEVEPRWSPLCGWEVKTQD